MTMDKLVSVLPRDGGVVVPHGCDESLSLSLSFEQRTRLTSIRSLAEFLEFVKSCPDTTVEICVGTGPEKCVLADTTLPKTELVPACRYHMWAFYAGPKPFFDVGYNGTWKRVTHTVNMWMYTQPFRNVLFVLHPEDFVLRPGVGNCCFPSFLAPDRRVQWGPAFDMKQLSTTMELPTDHSAVAAGLAVTVDTDTAVFKTPVKLRLNGSLELTLTRL
jgi:hypothetical protein